MISRTLADAVVNNLKPGFVNLIYGPRRVGKTVLLNQLVEKMTVKEPLWFNGDTKEAQEALSNTSQIHLTNIVKNHQVIIVDEAQRITNIGLSLKILVDAFPKKEFFVTGSSSLMLSRGIQESLTGRSLKYRLFPLSTPELTTDLPDYQKPSLLAEQLRFGGYPYLQQLTTSSEKQAYLKSIINDYLFRDVLLLKDVSSPENLLRLATLLAFQVGSEVSLNELATNLGIDNKTVRRYLSLLNQSFITFEVGSFSRNLRKEIAKSKKYYFWDLGIRNALTDQFLALDSRTDLGQLWENFLAIERVKKHEYQRTLRSYYFWRTYEKAEIDWLETHDGKIEAFEFKWGGGRIHTPKAFREAYGEDAHVISKENYLDFLL